MSRNNPAFQEAARRVRFELMMCRAMREQRNGVELPSSGPLSSHFKQIMVMAETGVIGNGNRHVTATGAHEPIS